VLNRHFLPAMLERGGGTIVYITSLAAFRRPSAKASWGLCYAMSKAAGHAIVGALAHEYSERGIRAFNLEPGPTITERIAQEIGDADRAKLAWEPVEVVAESAYWLATSRDADALNGSCVFAQELCHERGLLPGWTPKARSHH
jgi:NAD(P)-dependent dehydrogenase (short-subunit alcohol dehydrogenase family)